MKTDCNLLKDEGGVAAAEYAFLAALIAVAIAGAFASLGNEVSTQYETVDTRYGEANRPPR